MKKDQNFQICLQSGPTGLNPKGGSAPPFPSVREIFVGTGGGWGAGEHYLRLKGPALSEEEQAGVIMVTGGGEGEPPFEPPQVRKSCVDPALKRKIGKKPYRGPTVKQSREGCAEICTPHTN